MKKIILLFAIFIIITFFSISCPIIQLWDRSLTLNIQVALKNLPLWIPLLPDCKLYTIMIILPIVIGSIDFYKKRLYFNIFYLSSISLVAFLLNCIIKPLIHKARPPFELQLAIHPHSYSYVSSHSLVTICLWGLIIYFINKYCSNSVQKWFDIIIASLWILFVGISRIWLGVHNPSDVVGAYILGLFLLSIYIHLIEKGVANE